MDAPPVYQHPYRISRINNVLAGIVAFILLASTSVRTASAQNSARQAKVMLDETYRVHDGSLLFVNVPDAHVVVKSTVSGTSHVVISLSAKSMKKAERYYEDLLLSVSEIDGGIRIVSNRKKRQLPWNWYSNTTGGAAITISVSIPEMFDVDIATSDGDVVLETVRGTIRVQTSDGNLSAGRLTGPSVNLRTSDGDVKVDGVSSPTVRLRSSDGDMEIESIASEDAEVATSDGSIRIGSIAGSATVRTSDGNIRVDESSGYRFSARTSDGNISIGRLMSERSEVHTSDGTVRIEGLAGTLETTSSDGDIFVQFARPAAATIRASDGDIVLVAPASIGLDVNFSAENVRLSSDFKFRGRVEKKSVSGQLNGGGPEVRARSSGGNLFLRVVD